MAADGRADRPLLGLPLGRGHRGRPGPQLPSNALCHVVQLTLSEPAAHLRHQAEPGRAGSVRGAEGGGAARSLHRKDTQCRSSWPGTAAGRALPAALASGCGTTVAACQPVPGTDPAGSGQGLTSPWPQGRCPSCGTALDGGPVLFRCATCAKAVPAADLDMERGAGGPTAGDGVLACHKDPSPDPRV